MDNDLIEFTAEELRRVYCAKANKAGFLPRNDKFRALFNNAAKLCIECDAEPENYVNAHFAKYGLDNIQAAYLQSDSSKKIYHEYMDRQTLSLPDSYEVQKMYLRLQIQQAKRTVESILMDDDIKLLPWFRICITKEPIQEVIDKYLEEAKEAMTPKLRQFLENKGLDHTRITND